MRPAQRTTRRLAVAAAVLGSAVLLAEVGTFVAVRSVLDARREVSALRLDAALKTFRPVGRAGLALPSDPLTFLPDHNPWTTPASCAPLTALTATPPVEGWSWTGINGRPAQPVTLLALRFADADAARAQLDRKRLAMLRCTTVAVTFPPYDAPAVTYTVTGRRWPSSAVGDVVRWSLVGGGRRFDFYVRRYANVVSWTYADDVSTPQVREQVADSLVDRLQELASR